LVYLSELLQGFASVAVFDIFPDPDNNRVTMKYYQDSTPARIVPSRSFKAEFNRWRFVKIMQLKCAFLGKSIYRYAEES
jgi:hypothetical protein